MKKFRCYAPWRGALVNVFGGVSCCCFRRGGPLGSLRDSSLEEVWNGAGYQRLREDVSCGDYKSAGCAECRLIKQNLSSEPGVLNSPIVAPEMPDTRESDIFSENLKLNVEEYEEGGTVLESKPVFYAVTFSHACNLNCIMCWERRSGKLHKGALPDKTIDEVSQYYKYADNLVLTGGEPFFLKPVTDFIANKLAADYPHMRLCITTNGTLVDAAVLEKLKKFHKVALTFSIDGFTKGVYEKIRCGAQFEKTITNLGRAWTTAQKLGWFMNVVYVVMKSNILDLPAAVRFCAERKIPLMFSPVSGVRLRDENIFRFKELLYSTPWQESVGEAIVESYSFDHTNPGLGNLVRKCLIYLEKQLR